MRLLLVPKDTYYWRLKAPTVGVLLPGTPDRRSAARTLPVGDAEIDVLDTRCSFMT